MSATCEMASNSAKKLAFFSATSARSVACEISEDRKAETCVMMHWGRKTLHVKLCCLAFEKHCIGPKWSQTQFS